MDDLEYHGEKVNINTASAKEISEKTGLSLTIAYSITGVRKRRGYGYKSLDELVGVTRITEGQLKKYGNLLTV